jgi:hypothetical protein
MPADALRDWLATHKAQRVSVEHGQVASAA